MLILALTLTATLAPSPLRPALAPPAASATATARVEIPDAIDWFQGPYFSALGKAKAENRLVFVAFLTDDSAWCRKLVTDTFTDAGVATELADVVCVKVNATRDAANAFVDPKAAAIERRFAIKMFPSLFFVSSEGKTDDVVAGYIPPGPLISEIRRVKQAQGTLSALEAAVAQAPEDIQARITLAKKLDDIGDVAGHDAQMQAVRELDPEGTSTPVRRIEYQAVVDAMVSEFDDSKNHYPTEPLVEFLKEEKNTDVIWEGWSYLANLYRRLDRDQPSRDAHKKAWKHVPETEVLRYGYTLTQQFWDQREDLKRSEKRLALNVAERMATKMATLDNLQPAAIAALEDTIACARFLNGKRDEALAALDRALKIDPQNTAYLQRREVFGARR